MVDAAEAEDAADHELEWLEARKVGRLLHVILFASRIMQSLLYSTVREYA
jgi:hypothetical protein